MKILDVESFERARRFLKTEARPLERYLFEHRFEGAGVELALVELAHFQNEDGGFGRALEPDLRTPGSSALATALGLEVLKELDCGADHPMVTGAIDYLRATFDRETRVWPVAHPATNLHPHAPWWHDEDGSLRERFGGFRIIPRVLIVGMLNHFSTSVSAAWLEPLTEETVQAIERVEVLGEGGGSDLEYAIKLEATGKVSAEHRARVRARILKAIPDVVVRDPGQWDSYCITPLKAIPTPTSLGNNLIRDEVNAHLDYAIEHQMADGSWEPTWTWGGWYPSDWDAAKHEWCGLLTLDMLKALNVFGRIEGVG